MNDKKVTLKALKRSKQRALDKLDAATTESEIRLAVCECNNVCAPVPEETLRALDGTEKRRTREKQVKHGQRYGLKFRTAGLINAMFSGITKRRNA